MSYADYLEHNRPFTRSDIQDSFDSDQIANDYIDSHYPKELMLIAIEDYDLRNNKYDYIAAYRDWSKDDLDDDKYIEYDSFNLQDLGLID